MATKPLKTLTFEGLDDTYTIPQIDDSLSTTGHAADAKVTGDALADKAPVDGTVGTAHALVGGKYTPDSEPYHFRQSPSGGAKDEVIVGGSLGWNQFNALNDLVFAGGNMVRNEDNSVTIEYTRASGDTAIKYVRLTVVNEPYISSNVYLLYTYNYYNDGGCKFYIQASSLSINANSNYRIYKNAGSDSTQIAIRGVIPSSITSVDITARVSLIDLTTMFGSAIADYIYSLETATAGAGVAFIKRYLDLDTYHEYDAGSIQSVEGLVSHDVVGKNLAHPEAYVTQGTTLYKNSPSGSSITQTSTGFLYNDTGTNRGITVLIGFFKDGQTVTFSAVSSDNLYRIGFSKERPVSMNVTYSQVRSVGNNDGSWTFTATDDGYYWAAFYQSGHTFPVTVDYFQSEFGSVATEYEPYEKHSYPLDSTLTLRGLPKLDSNNQIYFDGDRYLPSGIVERICAERAYQSGDESLTDAITDGTTTVYKLTTPTTETAQPFQSPMLVGKTEEYVSDSVVPVGHESRYYEDITGKVNRLPSNFSSLIAPDEDTFKATRNYAVGSYVIVNNQLYKVTSAISTDGTITPNSNVTATTIMAEILALA